MINVAVVGIGDWGKNWLHCINESEKASLYFICDSDKSKLAKFKKLYSSSRFTNNIKDIISEPLIDGIIIATSAPTHFDIAKAALKAHKDVLIEKPFVLKESQATQLIDLADKNKRVLMVGHLLRYHPAVVKLKTLIDKKEIGDIYYICSKRLNLGKIRQDENALWSFAPHDLSVMLHLLDEKPKAVNAIGGAYLQKNIEDLVFVNLYFSKKRIAHIHVSWLDPHKIRQIIVVGSKKMAVFDDMEPKDKLKVYDKGAVPAGEFLSYKEGIRLKDGPIYIPPFKMEEPLKEELNHFLDCIIRRRIPCTDGQESLAVVKILEAAQLSMRKKGAFVKMDW